MPTLQTCPAYHFNFIHHRLFCWRILRRFLRRCNRLIDRLKSKRLHNASSSQHTLSVIPIASYCAKCRRIFTKKVKAIQILPSSASQFRGFVARGPSASGASSLRFPTQTEKKQKQVIGDWIFTEIPHWPWTLWIGPIIMKNCVLFLVTCYKFKLDGFLYST
jgi:hypothetical protein